MNTFPNPYLRRFWQTRLLLICLAVLAGGFGLSRAQASVLNISDASSDAQITGNGSATSPFAPNANQTATLSWTTLLGGLANGNVSVSNTMGNLNIPESPNAENNSGIYNTTNDLSLNGAPNVTITANLINPGGGNLYISALRANLYGPILSLAGGFSGNTLDSSIGINGTVTADHTFITGEAQFGNGNASVTTTGAGGQYYNGTVQMTSPFVTLTTLNGGNMTFTSTVLAASSVGIGQQNLTLNVSGTILASGNIEPKGDFTINGNLSGNNNLVLSANGNFTMNGTLMLGTSSNLTAGKNISTNGTVTLGNSSKISAGGNLTTGTQLSLGDSSNLTINGSLLTNGTVILGNLSKLSTNNSSLTISAQVSLGNSSNLTANGNLTTTGTVTMGNSSNLTANGSIVTNGTITLGNSSRISANNNLTINTQLALGDSSNLIANGNLTINGTVTMGNSSNLSINQDFIINGAISLGNNSTVNYSGNLMVNAPLQMGSNASISGGCSTASLTINSTITAGDLSVFVGSYPVLNTIQIYNGGALTTTTGNLGFGNPIVLNANTTLTSGREIDLNYDYSNFTITNTTGNGGIDGEFALTMNAQSNIVVYGDIGFATPVTNLTMQMHGEAMMYYGVVSLGDQYYQGPVVAEKEAFWPSGAPPQPTVKFISTNGGNLTFGGGFTSTYNSIVQTTGNVSFNAGIISATLLSVSGNNIYLGGNATLDSIFTLQASGNVSLGPGVNLTINGTASQSGWANGALSFPGVTITVAGHDLSLPQPISLTNGTSTILTTGQSITLSGVLSGNGNLVKDGAGTLLLNAANTFTGWVNFIGGTLQLGNSNALQNNMLLFNTSGTAVSFGNLTAATLGGFSGVQNITLTNANSAPVTLTVGGANLDLTYSGVISGTGGLVKTGSTNWYLNAANNFTGNTTILSGTLELDNSNALQNSTVVYNAGRLSFGNQTSIVLGGLSGSQNVSLTNNASTAIALTVGGSNQSTTFSGNLNGTGSLTKTGTGSLNLSGNVSLNTTTTINSGTLNVTGATIALNSATVTNNATLALAGSSLVINGNITNNGSLILSPGSDLTYSGTISGNGTLTKSGGNTVTLSGNNAYTGTTTVTAGTLQLGTGNASGMVSGNIFNNGNLTLNFNGNLSYGNVISGTGGVTLSGAANVTFSGADSYTGTTTISNGTLNLTGNVAGLTGNLVDGTALNFNLGGNSTFSGNISGGGTVAKSGNSTLTLSGNNSYNGGTTITQGTIRLSTGSALGNISNNLTLNGGTLDLNSNNITVGFLLGNGAVVDTSSGNGTTNITLQDNADSTYSGNFFTSANKTVQLVKTGTGNLTLANTPSETIVNAGTLNLTNISSGLTREIVDNSNVVINANQFISNITISGNGNLNLVNCTIQGNLSYTGDTVIEHNPTSIEVNILGLMPSASGNLILNGSFDLHLGNLTTSFNGTVSGPGDFTIGASNGTFTFGGMATYTGNTNFGTGTLNYTQGFTSAAGATFINAGYIGGNITILGTLLPGSATTIGTATFNNDLTLGSNATLSLTVNGTTRGTQYSAINVGGNLTLGGTLALTFGGNFTPSVGVSFSFFQANGTVTGAFANVTLPTINSNLTWNTSLLATTGTIRADAINFPQWVAQHNLSGNDALAATRTYGAYANFERYAMNLDTTPAPAGSPALSLTTIGGTPYLVLQYRERKDMSDCQLVPQYSTDLVVWTNVDAGNITQLADANAYTAQYQASAAFPPGGPVFLRVVAEPLP